MYKSDYTKDDFVLVADECSENIKKILQDRYNELEEMRDAINDNYRLDDLFVAQAKVDYEQKLIHNLIKYLGDCTLKIKNDINNN